MFNTKRFKEILEQYKSFVKSEDWKKNEKFKWIAVKEFQEHWDIDANNFAAMWEKATKETGPLLMSNHCYPLGVVQELARRDVERVKNIFSALFQNPDAPSEEEYIRRVIQFRADMEQFFKEDPSNEEKNTYQDERVISTYLWLKYPDAYGIYKFTEIKEAMGQLEYEDIVKQKKGMQTENLKKILTFSEELSAELRKDSELRTIMKERLTEDCYADEFLVTLTIDFIFFISRYLNQGLTKEDADADGGNYWWLNANPKEWKFSDMKIGEEVSYTLINEKGNKRQVYKDFLDAKKGERVIMYQSSPTQKVVAIGEVSQEHDEVEIWFKKTEEASHQVSFKSLNNYLLARGVNTINNMNRTFFRITEAEYNAIYELTQMRDGTDEERKREFKESEIRESPDGYLQEKKIEYTKDNFLKDVFMEEEQYEKLRAVLLHKKNIILKGAPGVGKTYAAERLSFSIMGEVDRTRIEFVQFHQNYAYEDFMIGYKPTGDGFFLKEGVFYRFCEKARKEPKDKPFFFIIDEINRGNMSKIFGELLMAMESDYRGRDICLAYEERRFSVPENVYIIGMMNTSDRSLAMIDYALRRRFSFFEMEPAFETKAFESYLSEIKDMTESAALNQLILKIIDLNQDIKKDTSLGKGFCIGHSYFCNLKEWLKKYGKEEFEDRLSQIVDYDILPMLEEYWFDDEQKVVDWRKYLQIGRE